MAKLLLTLILLIGAGVIGLFFLRPEWSAFQTTKTNTQHLRDTIAELDELIANRDSLLRSVNAISQEDLKRINQAFPQGPKAAELIVLLESLGSKNGVRLKRIDLGSTAGQSAANQPRLGAVPVRNAPNTIQELSINIGISGTYQSIKAFLVDLEKTARVVAIKEIAFGAPLLSTDAIDATIRAASFYQL